MQKWEYRIVHRTRTVSPPELGPWMPSIMEILIPLGQEGWELTTVIPETHELIGQLTGILTQQILVFKRPVQEG